MSGWKGSGHEWGGGGLRGGIACSAPDAYISITSSRSDGGLVKLVLALTLYPREPHFDLTTTSRLMS